LADGIAFEFSSANGQSIRSMFDACGDTREVLDDFGGHKQRQIVASMATGAPLAAAPPGAPPDTHSMSFAQSITYEAGAAYLAVGTHSPRGRILQEGGLIEAQDHLLTIPLSEESYGKRARDFPDAVLTFRKTAEGLLAFLVRPNERQERGSRADWLGDRSIRQKFGKTGRAYYMRTVKQEPTFLFVLKQSVLIQPHPYLAWVPEDEQYLMTALQQWFMRN
jgi:hypothetical protein